MRKDKDLVTLGRKVKALREKSAMSQEELAERAGLDRTFICMCERSRRNITVGNLFSLAKGLRCDPAELLRPGPGIRFRKWWI